MATRSRRRQRPVSSDNSLTQQPKAKRQRRPLTDSTFVNPDPQNAQPPEMLEVKNDKIARLPSHPDGIENVQTLATKSMRREVAVRPKKPKQAERTSKSDGSVELVRQAEHIIAFQHLVSQGVASRASTNLESLNRQDLARTP